MIIVLKRTRAAAIVQPHAFKRRDAAVESGTNQTFYIEFTIATAATRRRFNQIKWTKYSV